MTSRFSIPNLTVCCFNNKAAFLLNNSITICRKIRTQGEPPPPQKNRETWKMIWGQIKYFWKESPSIKTNA